MRAWALIAAGVIGAAGVIAAAASAHVSASQNLTSMALICLAHAPALAALGLAGPKGRLTGLTGVLLAGGAALFAGDMAAREAWGTSLFPMAAPIGGTVVIAGWLALAAVGVVALLRRSPD